MVSARNRALSFASAPLLTDPPPARCLPACLQWNAQARKANTAAARKLQHEKHVALIKLRSQVAQAAKQQ